MRKYLFIFKSEVMSNLQYIVSIMIGFITCFMLIFVFINLWDYLYSDPTQIINGYTRNQMIWYVILTEVLWMSLGGRGLCRKISNDVRNGNIAYNLNKPYSYIGYSLFSHLGGVSIKLVMYLLLGILTGVVFLGNFPSINILSFIVIIISMILAIVVNALFIIFIGLFSFIIEDSNPLYWLYSKFLLVLGTVFPIEYFPKVIQSILVYTPIYVTCYGPAKLFVDFSWDACLNILVSQFIYVFIACFICYAIYQKGVKKLNVNGG